MPFVYRTSSNQVSATSPFATGTANTEVEQYFLKPGTRNVAMNACYMIGRGAGLTAISGIELHFYKWTTTANSGGTAIVPAPSDIGMQAAKATSGAASAGVTVGTGGPTFLLSFGSGAAGPGGWVAPNPDSTLVIEGSATQSLMFRSISGTATLNFNFTVEHIE